MANAFKKKTSKAVGTSYFQIGANEAGADKTGRYAVPADTETTVIGLSVSNVTGSSVDVDLAQYRQHNSQIDTNFSLSTTA